MLKKTITYSDLEGNEITEDFYFNLNKAEIVELELSHKDGLTGTIERITKEQDGRQIIELFKEIIKLSYGKKSEDGKRFVKRPEDLEEFMSSEAYSELFFELATDAMAGANFVNGIVPTQASLNPDELKQKLRENMQGHLPKSDSSGQQN